MTPPRNPQRRRRLVAVGAITAAALATTASGAAWIAPEDGPGARRYHQWTWPASNSPVFPSFEGSPWPPQIDASGGDNPGEAYFRLYAPGATHWGRASFESIELEPLAPPLMRLSAETEGLR